MRCIRERAGAWAVLCLIGLTTAARAQTVIPHAQDKPPNDPRDPATAARMMTVPEGFTVEVVAAEPNIVNPVAMAIDERGRYWITESLEYPRREPGPGQDRVKILEDTDGDGAADKFTTFLDGLNIPSGLAVGHGGVWIANAPDILFVPDANRDGVPDGPAEVVVTGFGREDTHELPNAFTWGPDGWLYGLNGVFNHCHVKYPPNNPNYAAAGGDKQPGWPITCAMFRIHPRTREFEVFCEGTSNPWGIAFNGDGDAFISACVIDHLWHLTETGYYHRQGGPYPPNTWKIESIVKHKHQKAAYCGITWFDSDAYPAKYRNKLYMGNIHGGCLNVDRIERKDSTYAGFGEDDFLTANDAWFMPVVQQTGPDGSLYVLDWYDRYHCYQDANRDPAGIDRLKGRLYRVRYQDTPRAAPALDLAKSTDAELIERLGHPNGWMRETARRVIQERNSFELIAELRRRLKENAFTNPAQGKHAVFALMGCDLNRNSISWHVAEELIASSDPFRRAWGLRCLSTQVFRDREFGQSEQSPESVFLLKGLADESPIVRLQAMIAVAKQAGRFLNHVSYEAALAKSLLKHPDDLHAARIAWQTLKATMPHEQSPGTAFLAEISAAENPIERELRPRLIDWMLSREPFRAETIAELFAQLRDKRTEAARSVLAGLTNRVQSGELKGKRLEELQQAMAPSLSPLLKEGSKHPLGLDASLLALSWKDPQGGSIACQVAQNLEAPAGQRIAAFRAIVAAQHQCSTQVARVVLDRGDKEQVGFVGDVLAALGRLESPSVGRAVLERYAKLAPELQPRAIELLTQRTEWAKELLVAIGKKDLPATAINVNQARRLFDTKDAGVRELLAAHWGVVREGRSPDRDLVIAEMRAHIRRTKGDAIGGQAVFKKVCAQCHKLHGEGVEVGPDITNNGRNDYTQLLSNVFDPSLVIGAGYRSYTVLTEDGRVINGLLAEESPQRVVLKVQGGKQEIIARDNIDEFKVSEISLMPEALERQLPPQEIADLFAYITLDKPPTDPNAKRLPGVYDVAPRESHNAAEFAAIFQEVAPGFTQVSSGERGVGLLREHHGRPGVVRTHPLTREQPASMTGKFKIPEGKRTTLVVDVSHDPRGDWRLVVSAGPMGGRLIDELVGKKTCPDGWATFTADLTKFAGQEIPIRLVNQANDWAYEFAYWGGVRVISE